MTASVSIVLPAYNSAGYVADSVQHLRNELGDVFAPLELIVVDDGSHDATAQQARDAGADQVVTLAENRGKGAAVRAGVKVATGEVVVFTDVDLSYGPEVIQQVVAGLGDDTPVCVGSRGLLPGTSSSRLRRAGSNYVSLLARMFLGFQRPGKQVADTQCGIKAFTRDCAQQLFGASRIDRFLFDIELFHLMFKWKLGFKTVAVQPAEAPSSTVRAWRDGIRALVDIVRIARFERAGVYPATMGGAAVAAPAESALSPADMATALDAVVKSYDIRGQVPAELNEAVAYRLGLALARFWQEDDPSVTRIVCGRDMRHSGESLAASFMEAVSSSGLEVVDLGLASTDMLYFASAHLDAPGAVFTASHNPAHYNGIKVCRRQAVPIGSGTGLERVKELALQASSVAEPPATAPAPSAASSSPAPPTPPKAITPHSILPEFVAHVRSFVDVSQFKPLRVVVDCGNGMAGLSATAVLNGLPLDLVWLYPELDGSFPNHPADPLNPDNLRDLQAKVAQCQADAGLAFDGDGDRVFFVDEQAKPLSGSTALGLLASAALAKHPGATVLYNVVCSKSVPELIGELGGQAVCTRVGHSHIKAQMAQTQAVLGGEHSGHYYFKDNSNADSGVIAAVLLLELLSQAEQPLSLLRQPCERYAASGEANFRLPAGEASTAVGVANGVATAPSAADQVINKIAQRFAEFPQQRLDGLSVDAGDWWFNVRSSQTEPLVRVNLEAASAEECQRRLAELAELIQTG